jgi:hypothetical protein
MSMYALLSEINASPRDNIYLYPEYCQIWTIISNITFQCFLNKADYSNEISKLNLYMFHRHFHL